jgi:hypothetical protein
VVGVGHLISKEWIGKTFSSPVTGKVVGDSIELKIGDKMFKGGWTEDYISCTSQWVEQGGPVGGSIPQEAKAVLKVKKV